MIYRTVAAFYHRDPGCRAPGASRAVIGRRRMQAGPYNCDHKHKGCLIKFIVATRRPFACDLIRSLAFNSATMSRHFMYTEIAVFIVIYEGW